MKSFIENFQFVLFFVSFATFFIVLISVAYSLAFPFGIFRPILKCENASLDLGTVRGDERITCHFTLQNVGNRRLEFEGVQPACGSGNDLENLSFSVVPLEPGEERECSLLFRPRLLLGNVTKKVVIFSNDPKIPRFVLSLQATVVPVAPVIFLDEPTLAPVIE